MSYALRERIGGGFVTQPKYNSSELTAPARAAFLQRFFDAIPADPPLAERHRRALLARKAYFARLALASAQARAKQTHRGRRGGAL
jgi:hypothetical protein